MKTIMIISAALLTVIAARPCFGQITKSRKPSLNVGLEAAVPTGDMALITPFGLGGSIKVVFPLSNNIGLTASAGYLYFLKKTIFDVTVGGFHAIPLKGGLRICTNNGIYVEPQAGYTFFGAGQGADGAFTFAGNVGYLLNNTFDISARYESAIKDGLSLAHIGIRIAYNFKL